MCNNRGAAFWMLGSDDNRQALSPSPLLFESLVNTYTFRATATSVIFTSSYRWCSWTTSLVLSATSYMLERATFATERAKEFVTNTGVVISKARTLVSGDALFFSVAPKIDDLRYGLASESTFDKIDAMKRIVAQVCRGADMSMMFPDVVKNIHVPSPDLRKLIYLFVVHYAEACPNVALLSIAAFQKDLVAPSVHVRSLALRMLSSIHIPAIHPVVMVAVKKCSTDAAPIVRKTAAIALVQVSAVARHDSDLEQTVDILKVLLMDKDPEVVGAAVMAMSEVCHNRDDLVHSIFRTLCQSLPDCDEWSQIVIMRVLLRYARRQFCDPSLRQTLTLPLSKEKLTDDSDNDESTSSSSWLQRTPHKAAHDSHAAADAPLQDPDHQLLLNAIKPLLKSMNSAVVVGACAILKHCYPECHLATCVKPLMRVYRFRKEGQDILLNTIYGFILQMSDPFVPYMKDFFLMPSDAAPTRALKHRIISRLVTSDNFNDVYQEYRCYIRSLRPVHVIEAVRGVGYIATRVPSASAQLVHLLTPLLQQGGASPVTTECLIVLRLLITQGKDKMHCSKLVFRLMQDVMQGRLETPLAVATVLWLVGENIRSHASIATAAPDCFRIFLNKFVSLDVAVKSELLTLGCKLWMHLASEGPMVERFKQLYLYALELAAYDDNYLIRDRTRTLRGTIHRQELTFVELKAALLAEKPTPKASDTLGDRAHFETGTCAHYFGRGIANSEEIPPWRTEPPCTALRDLPHSSFRADDRGIDSHNRFSSSDSSSEGSYRRRAAPANARTTAESFYSEDTESTASSETGSEKYGENCYTGPSSRSSSGSDSASHSATSTESDDDSLSEAGRDGGECPLTTSAVPQRGSGIRITVSHLPSAVNDTAREEAKSITASLVPAVANGEAAEAAAKPTDVLPSPLEECEEAQTTQTTE